jgi:transcriptional antiterminator NusG
MLKPISIALEELSPEARAELSRPFQSFDPRNAEIVAGKTPKWYLLEVYEPWQRDVEKELVKRRFGIFVPEFEKTEIVRGRKIERKLSLFPGYVFVFVWDIDSHWSRIMDVPGVSQIMASKPDIAQPAQSSPQLPHALAIDFELIDEIRAIENSERPLRKRRTRGKRQHDDDVIAVHPWTAFSDRLCLLDSEGRNQTLRKALGLA